jgi:SAM-dependent methyltransferase
MIQDSVPNLDTIKARQKAAWEAGDFGQVAKFNMPAAEEFMARLPLRPGMRVLDVACGTGNLAIIAARAGCIVSGLDIASNLIAQARERARDEGLFIDFHEGDAEAMPLPDARFDLVVSMFGVMFAPRANVTAAELFRVTKAGGRIALANWTPQGFIGKMSDVFRRHLPPQPGLPSPLLWGDESTVRERLGHGMGDVELNRRIARLCYPFDPAGTVEFFRQYYGPTQRAFAALEPEAQAALHSDLVELQTTQNRTSRSQETVVEAEYLELRARKAV